MQRTLPVRVSHEFLCPTITGGTRSKCYIVIVRCLSFISFTDSRHPFIGHVLYKHPLSAYFKVYVLTNMTGAIWADLVPTVIALAVYFCIADFVLISQCLYYNHINAVRAKRHPSIQSTTSHDSENSPLLTRRRSSDTMGLPGSHRRRSSAISQNYRRDSLTKILEDEEGNEGNAWIRNTLSILGVIVVGVAGWVLAWQSGVWKPTPDSVHIPEASNKTPFGAEFLGYFSAVCYLGYSFAFSSFLISSSPH